MSYFESYELMMDELRDYRFYKTDMVHPNDLAIDYIWEKFNKVWVASKVLPVMKKVEIIQKGMAHKPFNKQSHAHLKFLSHLEFLKEELKQEVPNLVF